MWNPHARLVKENALLIMWTLHNEPHTMLPLTEQKNETRHICRGHPWQLNRVWGRSDAADYQSSKWTFLHIAHLGYMYGFSGGGGLLMKRRPSIIVALMLTVPLVSAQTFSNLYTFTNAVVGQYPYLGLALDGDTLFGTTGYGGTSSNGTVFRINTDGSGFAVLHNFSARSFSTNQDGTYPYGGVVCSGGKLYGTTSGGGAFGGGVVFCLSTEGTDFRSLHDFTHGADGKGPFGGVIVAGGTIFGTTESPGTIFRMSTDGGGFTTLHTFTNGLVEGYGMEGNLALSSNMLYGTAIWGGGSNVGTLFKINTDGEGFAVLHTFTGGEAGGDDGAYPWGSALTVSDGVLYGATRSGFGDYPGGAVFKVNCDGSGFTVLHSFTSTKVDGAEPNNGLVLVGDTLFGAAMVGGTFGNGTLFSVKTNGTGFTSLHGIAPTEGAGPLGGLVGGGNTLYGTTAFEGAGTFGTVFAFTVGAVDPTPLFWEQTRLPSLGNVLVLAWTNNAFRLQAARTASGIYTNVPNASSPFAIFADQPQMFFRLHAGP
jgi:uncharacterized repeat protein (TIGR03803 family)